MPLDPYLADRVPLLIGLDHTAWGDPDAQSRLREFRQDPAPWSPPADVTWRDDSAPGPNGPVAVRVYEPSGAEPEVVVVWVHGGGFLGGDLEMNEAHMVAAELAGRSSSTVISVGYRLARDGVRFPVPLHDVMAAWSWSIATFRPTRILLGGASAGAALALATALSGVDGHGRRPDGLVLAYPFAHFPNPAPPAGAADDLAGLPPLLRFTAGDIEAMVENYTGRLSDLPPLALPGMTDPAGLPPTLIIVSEVDDLRGSGELLGRQLTAAGVACDVTVAAGMPHGHLDRSPSLGGVDASLEEMSEHIRRIGRS